MSETQSPPTGTPNPPSTGAPSSAPEASGSGVYAAYDKTFQRYVGGTHPTKAKAKAAAKAKGVDGDQVEIREV